MKIVIVGNGSVGKSSLIRRFCKDIYNPTYRKTIGVEYLEKDLPVRLEDESEETVRLMLYDCAGQEDFDKVTKEYYHDADAVILAFSTNDRGSFEMVKGWRTKLLGVLQLANVTTVLVQNKIDLMDEAQVQPHEAEQLARELQVRFYRVSVKDNVQIGELFQYLATQFVKRRRQEEQERLASIRARENLFVKGPGAAPTSGNQRPSQNIAPYLAPNGAQGKKNNCIVS